MSARQRNVIEIAFPCQANSGPILYVITRTYAHDNLDVFNALDEILVFI